MIDPEKFVLIVGNSRSGTTILGSVIDSHPRMICAHESAASKRFWIGMDRAEIFADLQENARRNTEAGRARSHAIHAPGQEEGQVALAADKVWNPALLVLAGRLKRLIKTVGTEFALIHSIRNPFDVIATMHKHSGAALSDRLRWYRMHCEAAQMLVERGDAPIRIARSEDLIADPAGEAASLFDWLGYPADAAHLAAIGAAVYGEPNRSRHSVDWPAETLDGVHEMIDRFPFLAGYSFDS